MAIELVVGSVDLSSYIRVGQGDGLDPVDADRYEPQFAGSPSLTDYQPFVQTTARNRAWTVPLILSAATTDALDTLVRTIKADLKAGATVRFKPDGATSSTYFDLEAGRLDETFEHHLVRRGRLRCVLKLWTRSYGHTGTSRVVATFAGSQVAKFPVPSLIGDLDALAAFRITPGTTVNDNLVAWGIAPHPSYNPLLTASMLSAAVSGGTVFLGSQAIASTYIGKTEGASAAWRSAVANYQLTNTDGRQVGRSRVLAIWRHHFHYATAVKLRLSYGQNIIDDMVTNGVVYTPTSSADAFQVADLGEINIESRPNFDGQPTYNTPNLNVQVNVASGASAVSTYPIQISALVMVPVGSVAGFHRHGRNSVGTTVTLQARSHPDFRTWADTSFGAFDLAADYRGAAPQLPQQVASAPPHLVMFRGSAGSNFHQNNTSLSASVKATERFQFFQ